MMKKSKEVFKKLDRKWPSKYIPSHTSDGCPYCKKKIKNIEEHIKAKHKNEKPKAIEGERHGHE